jgi:hypothetical protein
MSANHLSAIGFRFQQTEDLASALDGLLAQAYDDGSRVMGCRHPVWTDPSGAAIAFHLRGNSIECLTPFFDASDQSAWLVSTQAPAVDPTCEHCGGALCDVVDAQGEFVTRAFIELASFQPYRRWLGAPRAFSLRLTALAYQAWFFPSIDAFRVGQAVAWGEPSPDGAAPKVQLADNAFLPEGSFVAPDASMHERARALFAGRVVSVQPLVNQHSRGGFSRVRVHTLPGILDVLLDPTSHEGALVPGSIALVRAWCVGRPDVPAPQHGWLARLFSR